MTLRAIAFPGFGLNTDPFPHLFKPLFQTERAVSYDIQRLDRQHCRVLLAVLGYAEDALEVSQEGNHLVVTGQPCADEVGVTVVERGIAVSGFTRRFHLGEHVVVTGAELARGILTIDLALELPEELCPRRIEIRGDRQAKDAKAAA